MNYTLNEELNSVLNSVIVGNYDSIEDFFDNDYGLINYIESMFVSFDNETLLQVFYHEVDGNMYYDKNRDDKVFEKYKEKMLNKEDVILDVEIHTLKDENTNWYEIVLCKDINVKFEDDENFVNIYNNNCKKYTCTYFEERVQ